MPQGRALVPAVPEQHAARAVSPQISSESQIGPWHCGQAKSQESPPERAAVMRQAGGREIAGRCGHRRPRGKEGALSQPGLTRAEHGNLVRVRAAGGGVAGRP